MSEKKYHVSINGFLARCTATKRACHRGGVHFSQDEYKELASTNDPRIRGTAVKQEPASYYAKAEAAYIASNKRLKRSDKLDAEISKYQSKLLKANKLVPADLHTSQEKIGESMETALAYAKEAYVQAGVNYGKASFIIQDMKNSSDPMKPITKRKDRLDDQIAEKTKSAAKSLKEDPQYAALIEKHEEAKRKNSAVVEVYRKVEKFRSDAIRERNAGWSPNHAEQGKFLQAKKWLKAGIPPEGREVATNGISPAHISIDDKGHINNAWVETETGEVERIIAYKERNASGFGALVTDKGTEVYTTTHYHSYKTDFKGLSKIILTNKNGTAYPADNFKLNESWDSGG